MSNTVIGRLVDLWVGDASFRTAMAQDPSSALRSAGLELSDAERSLLSTVDWTCSDAALEEHLSASC